MLYDPKWERPHNPGPRIEKADRFWFLVTAFVPVLILAETIAAALRDIVFLVLPLGAYFIALIFVGSRLRATSTPRTRSGRESP